MYMAGSIKLELDLLLSSFFSRVDLVVESRKGVRVSLVPTDDPTAVHIQAGVGWHISASNNIRICIGCNTVTAVW